MSLQPEAVAYHTDKNGSSYFFGGGSGGVTNPLNGDLDGNGYSIQNLQGLYTVSINNVTPAPTVTQLIVTPSSPLPLSTYCSGSLFVITPSYSDTALAFNINGFIPDNTFFNIQNYASSDIDISIVFNGTPSAVGTILASAKPGVCVTGVLLVANGSTWNFY